MSNIYHTHYYSSQKLLLSFRLPSLSLSLSLSLSIDRSMDQSLTSPGSYCARSPIEISLEKRTLYMGTIVNYVDPVQSKHEKRVNPRWSEDILNSTYYVQSKHEKRVNPRWSEYLVTFVDYVPSQHQKRVNPR
jgi:hypothetical protein